MITDMDGARESSTCRSDPFVTDLHNALVARTVRFFYGLSANSVPRFTADVYTRAFAARFIGRCETLYIRTKYVYDSLSYYCAKVNRWKR